MNCLRPALSRTLRYTPRQLHTSARAFEGKKWHGLTNILADDNPPPVQVRTITPQGIQLADGLILPSACIFLEGEVFLWDVPQRLWAGWTNEHFQVFDLVAPKPEILLLGTGTRIAQPPPSIRTYLNGLGIQVDAMDTRNACSTYNLLAEEGRRVAAALLPLTPQAWPRSPVT
ncbi:NADH dehydrogenase 1 alpha subcomplex assembly factor 3 [Mucidula mucida]|nr:NADH dehydrogenase 1 alpha subcomplex assembly factor 3 [Mucidula mucida]